MRSRMAPTIDETYGPNGCSLYFHDVRTRREADTPRSVEGEGEGEEHTRWMDLPRRRGIAGSYLLSLLAL